MRVLIILLFFSWSLMGLAQQQDCKRFKNGKFKQTNSTGDVWIIERKGSKQIEYSDFYNVRLRFKIKWIDDCTYTMKLRKVLENPDNVLLPEGMNATVQITETKNKSYSQKTTSNPGKDTLTSIVSLLD